MSDRVVNAQLDRWCWRLLRRLWGYRGQRVGEASNPGPSADEFVLRSPQGGEATPVLGADEPSRGVCVGEASNPGPSSRATPPPLEEAPTEVDEETGAPTTPPQTLRARSPTFGGEESPLGGEVHTPGLPTPVRGPTEQVYP